MAPRRPPVWQLRLPLIARPGQADGHNGQQTARLTRQTTMPTWQTAVPAVYGLPPCQRR
ncbi:MAG: hypothetical protein WAL16_15885 [Streptosporangiaceae bacterium]